MLLHPPHISHNSSSCSVPMFGALKKCACDKAIRASVLRNVVSGYPLRWARLVMVQLCAQREDFQFVNDSTLAIRNCSTVEQPNNSASSPASSPTKDDDNKFSSLQVARKYNLWNLLLMSSVPTRYLQGDEHAMTHDFNLGWTMVCWWKIDFNSPSRVVCLVAHLAH